MINKIKLLMESTNQPARYLMSCAMYYRNKGMSLREVIDAEYNAMLACSLNKNEGQMEFGFMKEAK